MAIAKLPTNASLKEVIDKFEELSLQDFSKGFDVEIRTDLPSEVKEDKIVIINNDELDIYFIGNEADVPINSIGVKYSIEPNNNNIYLDLKKSTIKVYLQNVFTKNASEVCSNVDAYIGKDGKWQQFSYAAFYFYSPSQMVNGVTSVGNWIKKSNSQNMASFVIQEYSEYLVFTSGWLGGSIYPGERYFNSAIDVTTFNNLRIVASGVVAPNGSNVHPIATCGLTTNLSDLNSFTVKATPTTTNSTEFILDISKLTGEYYFSVYGKPTGTDYSNSGTGECKIRVDVIEFS